MKFKCTVGDGAFFMPRIFLNTTNSDYADQKNPRTPTPQTKNTTNSDSADQKIPELRLRWPESPPNSDSTDQKILELQLRLHTLERTHIIHYLDNFF